MVRLQRQHLCKNKHRHPFLQLHTLYSSRKPKSNVRLKRMYFLLTARSGSASGTPLAWRRPGDLLRCPNSLKWLLLMQRRSHFTPTSPIITNLLTLFLMLSAHDLHEHGYGWGLEQRQTSESFAFSLNRFSPPQTISIITVYKATISQSISTFEWTELSETWTTWGKDSRLTLFF